MPKFDTDVQELKYKVLKEMARSAFNGTLLEDYNNIPIKIVPGPKPTMRCCIYKERAIVLERMKVVLGGDKNNSNVVEVLNIACDECPIGGYSVTEMCRGCIAHRCAKACKMNAISFDSETRQAKIDKTKCINCGMCAKACQYNAIMNYQRPCVLACKCNAISMDENYYAKIDDAKCIQCGSCVYQCPFGAIMDKSSIIDVINELKKERDYQIYALIAPSISSQFSFASVEQVIAGIKALGFDKVVEAAAGADMVAFSETRELAEKKMLFSSCCPSFVSLIKKFYPNLVDHISSSLSPMATIAKWIKEKNKTAKIVFIGPCISKKMEIIETDAKKYVDYVLTFEELQALIDSRNIDILTLPEMKIDDASYYGRIFARCGGLTDAMNESLKEQNIDFIAKSLSCSGIIECKTSLQKSLNPNKEFNFIEGMACIGGCIGGPSCLTHDFKAKEKIDRFGSEAKEKTSRMP